MDLGSLVFDWIVISGTSGWSSRAMNGHGKEYWCQYVRSGRLDDERWILCGLNNRLWSRYWAMGWMLSVCASCASSSFQKQNRPTSIRLNFWLLAFRPAPPPKPPDPQTNRRQNPQQQAELYIRNPIQWSTLFGNGAMGDIESRLIFTLN